MPSLFLKNFLRNFQKPIDKSLKICYNNYAEGEIHPINKKEREKRNENNRRNQRNHGKRH